MADHELYEYPGNFLRIRIPERRLSRMRIEMEEAQLRPVVRRGTDAPGFYPGCRFETGDRPCAEDALPSTCSPQVRHHAMLRVRETRPERQYDNDYMAIPAEVPFRPGRSDAQAVCPMARKPPPSVGPAGENIYCDEFGRVRVQFHWDRRGQRNDRQLLLDAGGTGAVRAQLRHACDPTCRP